MKLTDLNPRWLIAGGPGITRNGKPVPQRNGVGMSFDCPCGCGQRRVVEFSNPLDGGPCHTDDGHTWDRSGDTFETITLKPSIRATRPHGCGWHGYITNGEVTGKVEP